MVISAVDLFCGVGGLTYGMQRGGIPVTYGIDIDPACKFPFERNNDAQFLEKNVAEVTPQLLNGLFKSDGYRVLVGCAPCQPFSPYSHGLKCSRDDRWNLLDVFGELVVETLPDVLSMENVIELTIQPVYAGFLRKLKRAGYEVTEERVRCSDYGIPQERRRLVVLASLHGRLELKRPDRRRRQRTVRDAIGGLPPIEAGGASEGDRLHCTQNLSPLNLARIRASKPGGTWRDWDRTLISKCHRQKKGQSFQSVYGRMEWDSPSPTITTQFFKFGTGRFGHPTQDRALSLREGAILQTFPKHYQFIDPTEKVVFQDLGRLIGNAVPVRLGEVIARSIRAHLLKLQSSDASVSVSRPSNCRS